MKKYVVALLLGVLILIPGNSKVQAAVSQTVEISTETPEDYYLNQSILDDTIYDLHIPSLYYDNVSMVGLGFSIEGNQAECSLMVSGYSNVTKISSYLYLQRYVSGKWTTIAGGSFRKEINSNYLSYIQTKTLNTIGSYRTKTEIFVYTKDGSTELIEDVSNVEVY